MVWSHGTDSAFNAKSVPRYVLFQVTGSGSLTCPASSGVWLVPTERCVHAATKHCVYVDPLWIAGSLTCPASSGVIHRTLCSGCHQTLCICTPLWIDQPCNSHGLVPRNTVYMLPPNSVDRSTMQPTRSGPTEHCVNVASVNDSYLNRRI